MDPSPLPNPQRGGRMVAIFDGDVRRATANEQWLLHTPMSVSAGSNHVSNLVYFSGGERAAMVAFFDGSANSRFLENDGQTRLIIERYVGTRKISPKLEYRSTDETVPGSLGSNKT
eukprot:scaffold661_cov100-Skeletonema_menzelii.AAC.4